MDPKLNALIRTLYFAAASYIKWHDEYRCEEDYNAIKRMNNALEQRTMLIAISNIMRR